MESVNGVCDSIPTTEVVMEARDKAVNGVNAEHRLSAVDATAGSPTVDAAEQLQNPAERHQQVEQVARAVVRQTLEKAQSQSSLTVAPPDDDADDQPPCQRLADGTDDQEARVPADSPAVDDSRDAAAASDPPICSGSDQLPEETVRSTLRQAKDDTKLQRDLEYSQSDPGTGADGWLDVVGNGQLKKKTLEAGVGDREDRPKRGQLVSVRVERVQLEDGTTVTPRHGDADPTDPLLTFGLGDGEVISGLDLVIGLMQRGERAELYMNSRFAYGEKGLAEDGIPSEADLTYIVQLEDIQPEPKSEEMTSDGRLRIGNGKRVRGNWWFKREEYSHAVQCYRRALDFLDSEYEDFTGLPDDVHLLIEERLKVHNNLAAAQLKLNAHEAALRSIQLVLNCQPNNVKALFRKSKILSAQNNLSDAETELRKAVDVEPNNRVVLTELSRVASVRKREAAAERTLYRKMWGNDVDKKPPIRTRKSWTARVLVGSVLVGLAATMLYRFKLI